jgi:hypothetical protein
MTETELRALLNDAKVISQDALESNNTGFDDPDFVCECEACERFRSIISRIDAALAEPSLTVESLGDGNFKKVEKERDEARAEVERLRNALASVSLYEYESTSSASEKVHACARIARKALYGDKP